MNLANVWRLPHTLLPTGHLEIDLALGGGLWRDRLHEIIVPDPAHAGVASAFAVMFAMRLSAPLIWVQMAAFFAEVGQVHPLGLKDMGFDAGTLITCTVTNATEALRTAIEAARCHAIGVVVLETWRALGIDLTATRRLGLAARSSNVPVLLLRSNAELMPSSAWSRWRITAVPSNPFEADAPGPPTFALALIRNRARSKTGKWIVEWNSKQTILCPSSR